MHSILFLSGLDFKEKSIQVIRKTPEAYIKAGCRVDYIVARDNLKNGNYFYEDEFSPAGVNVLRFYWWFPILRARLPRVFSLPLGKLSSFVVVIKLAWLGASLLRHNKYDIIYGYELQGVLAMNILRLFCLSPTQKTVSRFQGTFLNEMFMKRQIFRLLFNIDLIIAIRLASDLCIMTDDGTQGNLAIKKIKNKKQLDKVRFWVNGVDQINFSFTCKSTRYSPVPTFISISRLVTWKRVDRCIRLLSKLSKCGLNDFTYKIIGEGEQRKYLEYLASELGIGDKVNFLGSLNHSDIFHHIGKADMFVSMYDSSNVGNPLLEAMRANIVIVTLSNGDTGKWIQHRVNGLIYDPNTDFYDLAAVDIMNLLNDDEVKNKILSNLRVTEKERLWTWEQRLTAEVNDVSSLCR